VNDAARAFFWRDGTMIDLGTLGGHTSHASAVNEHGTIVGWATSRTAMHAALWARSSE
jgi:uncharacterized membrane protein